MPNARVSCCAATTGVDVPLATLTISSPRHLGTQHGAYDVCAHHGCAPGPSQRSLREPHHFAHCPAVPVLESAGFDPIIELLPDWRWRSGRHCSGSCGPARASVRCPTKGGALRGSCVKQPGASGAWTPAPGVSVPSETATPTLLPGIPAIPIHLVTGTSPTSVAKARLDLPVLGRSAPDYVGS